MKKIIFALLLLPSMAYAGDDKEFDCHKNHDHAVECKAKKDNVAIQSIEINGGSCDSLVDNKIHHKIMNHDEKFTVPGSKECGYVAKITVHTHSGKTQHFTAM